MQPMWNLFSAEISSIYYVGSLLNLMNHRKNCCNWHRFMPISVIIHT